MKGSCCCHSHSALSGGWLRYGLDPLVIISLLFGKERVNQSGLSSMRRTSSRHTSHDLALNASKSRNF